MKKLIFILTSIIILTIPLALISPQSIAEEPEQPAMMIKAERVPELAAMDTLAITPKENLINAGLMPAVIFPDTKIEYNPTDEALFAKHYPGESLEYNINVVTQTCTKEAGTVFKRNLPNFLAVANLAINRAEQGHRGNTPAKCCKAKAQFAYKNCKVNPVYREYVAKMFHCWLYEKEGLCGSEWRIIDKDMTYMWSYCSKRLGYRVHEFRIYDKDKEGQIRVTPLKSEFWD